MLYIDSVMIAHRDLWQKYFGLPKITGWGRHSGTLWVDQDNLEKIYAAMRVKFASNWPLKTLHKMKKDLDALLKLTKLAKTTNSKTLSKIFDAMYPAWLSTYFPIMICRVIEEQVQKSIRDFPTTQQKSILDYLNHPYYPTKQQEYFKALSSIKKLDSNSIHKIRKQFGWIKTYVMDVKPLTDADIKQDFFRAKMRQKSEKVQTPRLNGKLSDLVKLGRLYCWFRDWRLFAISQFYYNLLPIFQLKAQELNLTYPEFRQLGVKELFSNHFNRKLLLLRQKDSGIVLLNDKIEIYTGSKLRRFKKDVTEKIKKTSFVTGLIANVGKASGKARIADAYSFDKVKKGEILITPETTPDAVPYLRGVKAIVTDEGGITSHAAIISRELNKPCIIGTKIATKIFRTGDRVEVDAYKGVVRKLK